MGAVTMSRLEELKVRLGVLHDEARQIQAQAEAEQRDLTVEEGQQLDGKLAEFDRVKADIERLTTLQDQGELLTQGVGRKTQPAEPLTVDGEEGEVELQPHRRPVNPAGRQTQPRDNGRDRGRDERGQLSQDRVPATYQRTPTNWNFSSLGDFALSVKHACLKGGEWDRRLIHSERLAAATIYGSEGTGADGGFAVPPDFRTTVMEAVLGEDSLLRLCDQITTAGKSMTFPVDETTPWQSTGGIQAYWGGEGGTKTQSKPALQERTVKLDKIYALVPVTDELIEDAPAMDGYLRRKAPAKIAYKVNEAILQGDGVGKPLGILNSPATVSVAKESSQVADTIVANNIIKMYSRMYAPHRSKAVWVMNQDIEPQLLKLSIPGTDNTGNSVTGWGGLVYLPANGFSGSPFGTLFGRPVIPSQAAETLGDKGDIFFADFSMYLALLRGGVNPRVDVSMHLWFDQDLTAFRFVLRVGGMPWWSAPVAARDGSATYSPFVTLDERG
jgi:HK97 family phage major capsid protein